MSNNIEKMKQNGLLVEIHPGGEADIPQLNELLKQHEEYIEGIEFTYARKLEGNEVQFCYDHPDSFTEKQTEIATRIVSEVKNNFMATK